MEILKSYCPYDCPSTCGLLLEVEDGRVVKVRNDPEHPVSHSGICRKMQRYQDDLNSEDRIMTPMRRTGEKGSGCFERITWDEAISEIADRFRAIIRDHGSEAIAYWSNSGVMSDIQKGCGEAFFNRLGVPKLLKRLCTPAMNAGYQSVAGSTGCLDPRELKDSDYYLIWGCNMAATRHQALIDLITGENKSKRKVLIDVYANPTARHCDQVVRIKAGTDGALALAMMHVLEEEDLADRAFLQEWTEGYEVWRQTLGPYTPEWAEQETGVPAEVVRQLAREYAAAKAPAIILGGGLSRRENGGMTARLITILSLYTGAWGKPGGGFVGCSPIDTAYLDTDRITRPDFRKGAHRELNGWQLAPAITAGGDAAIRALYVFGGNPANTTADQEQVIRGLEREDLFTVVHERFMTGTARYADILLPATFSAEQTDIYRCYGYCVLNAARRAVQPPGECKSNWETFRLLAEAMGFEEDYFRQSEDELFDDLMDHPTPAVAALTEEERSVLRAGGSVSMPFSDHLKVKTLTGKFRIVNEELEEPIPRYRAPAGGGPLRLVASPSLWTLNAGFQNRQALVDARGPQTLLLHPNDAAEREISDGDLVAAFNEQSEVLFYVRVTEEVAQGNAVSEGVYRRDLSPGGRSFNALTSAALSDLGGGTTLNGRRVEVRLAERM